MAVQLSEPRFEDKGLLVVAGLAKRYTPDKLSFIPALWTELHNQLGYFQGRVGGKTYGVWSDVLSGGKVFTYVAGVTVGEFAPIHPSLSRIYLPPMRYAVFAHRGPASEIRRTVDAIVGQWLPKSGRQHAGQDAPDFIEVYGENFDPEKGTGDIEIWLPLKA